MKREEATLLGYRFLYNRAGQLITERITTDIKHLKNLGPEPLEKNFNSKYFKNYIFKRNRNIKNILMDQKFISGIGTVFLVKMKVMRIYLDM